MLINQLLNWINSICTFAISREHEFVIFCVAQRNKLGWREREREIERMCLQCMWNDNSILSILFKVSASLSSPNWYWLNRTLFTIKLAQINSLRVQTIARVNNNEMTRVCKWAGNQRGRRKMIVITVLNATGTCGREEVFGGLVYLRF